MELVIISLVVFGTLFSFSVYTLKRRYARQLTTEEDRANSLAISESQLKQKNGFLAEELEQTKRQIELLSRELSQHSGKEKEVESKLEALLHQLSQESSQRSVAEEQLHKTKELIGATTAQLHSTIEERSTELQRIQQQLHDESVMRKRVEDILAAKEASYRQTINELNADVASLTREAASMTEQLQNETSSRRMTEHTKQSGETELQNTITLLESRLTALDAEYQRTSEMLREENNVRVTTEKALQESKEKLYALIHELEQKLTDRDRIIGEQRETIKGADARIQSLEKAVYNIISDSPIPVFVVNEHGMCEFSNEGLQTAIGFSEEDIAGKHFSKIFPESERTFYEDQWKQTANRTEEFKGETHILTSTGDTITAEMNFVEIHTGFERKFVGFIYDKTHEHEAERHYAEAKRREEELQQLKSRFIAMVSNQLRTALVTVGTNAELLERFVFKWSDEKRYRAFFRINESLKQMMELLRDVEFATGIDPDQYKQTITPVDLESLAQSIAKEIMAEVGGEHNFILSEQGSIHAVPLDDHITRTILYHLLSNAFKYSPDRSEVKIHIERNDSQCVVTIEDRGIGIPAGEQKHLFTSFFRASNAGNVHGTGLGLTIVRQYVQLVGGIIAVDSGLNKGTKVTVTLPVASS